MRVASRVRHCAPLLGSRWDQGDSSKFTESSSCKGAPNAQPHHRRCRRFRSAHYSLCPRFIVPGTRWHPPGRHALLHVHAAVHLRASSHGDTVPDTGRPADPHTLPGSADTYAAIHLRASSYGDAVPGSADAQAAPHLHAWADPDSVSGSADAYAATHLYPCANPDSTAHGNPIPQPPGPHRRLPPHPCYPNSTTRSTRDGLPGPIPMSPGG